MHLQSRYFIATMTAATTALITGCTQPGTGMFVQYHQPNQFPVKMVEVVPQTPRAETNPNQQMATNQPQTPQTVASNEVEAVAVPVKPAAPTQAATEAHSQPATIHESHQTQQLAANGSAAIDHPKKTQSQPAKQKSSAMSAQSMPDSPATIARQPDAVRFNESATDENEEHDTARRNAALVGLWGDLNGDHHVTGLQGDGGSNMAQVTFASEGACFDPQIDRSGKWMVFSSTMHRPTADVYIKSTTGKTHTQLTSDPANDVMPALSPDGKRLAFASDRSGTYDIYTMSIDGGQAVRVTDDPDPELHPTWSPDGSMLAYCKLGVQSGRWEIWVVDTRQPTVKHFLDYGLFPEWSPDQSQRKILFQRARERGSRFHSIWTLDYIDGEALHPTEIVSAANAAVINAAWAPDGQRIVFSTVVDPSPTPNERPMQSDVWLINLDGTNKVSLTNGKFANFQPTWGANNQVYFVSDRSGDDNIWSVDAERALRISKPLSPMVADAPYEDDMENSAIANVPTDQDE